MKKSRGLVAFIVFFILVYFGASVFGFDAPTNSKFEVVGSGNVNTHTGDISFSIPLLIVPGRGGMDYPIALSYASGISLEQQSDITGLGWGLNLPGIGRVVRGIPDDYYPTLYGTNPSQNVYLYDKVNVYNNHY